jgi:hypothetical protein
MTNHNDKFRKKNIIKVIFYKKWCYNDNVIFLLNIKNSLLEYLKLVYILKYLVYFNYYY